MIQSYLSEGVELIELDTLSAFCYTLVMTFHATEYYAEYKDYRMVVRQVNDLNGPWAAFAQLVGASTHLVGECFPTASYAMLAAKKYVLDFEDVIELDFEDVIENLMVQREAQQLSLAYGEKHDSL